MLTPPLLVVEEVEKDVYENLDGENDTLYPTNMIGQIKEHNVVMVDKEHAVMVVPKVDMLPLSNGRKRARRRGARNEIPDTNPLSGGGKSVAVFHGKGIADKKVANDISTLYNSSGNDIKSKQADVSTSEHKNKLMKKRLNMTTLGHRIWYEESQEAVQVQDAEDGDQVPAAEDGEQVLAAEDTEEVLAAEDTP